MKISIDPNDYEKGFTIVKPGEIKVFIDGREIGVIKADLDAGWAEVHSRDPFGQKFIIDDEAATEIIHGEISIIKGE